MSRNDWEVDEKQLSARRAWYNASGYDWKWSLVCNRVLGRNVHEVPEHDKEKEKAFWKS